MNRFKHLLLSAAAFIAIASCTKFKMFDDFYIAFSPGISDPTLISEEGTITCSYYVHYAGPQTEETSTVKFSIKVGDGLKEGVDYEVVTKNGTLSFLPGIYDLPIRIRFIPHTLEPDKDNSMVIRLEQCDNSDVTLGLPGPANNNREIQIFKYKE